MEANDEESESANKLESTTVGQIEGHGEEKNLNSKSENSAKLSTGAIRRPSSNHWKRQLLSADKYPANAANLKSTYLSTQPNIYKTIQTTNSNCRRNDVTNWRNSNTDRKSGAVFGERVDKGFYRNERDGVQPSFIQGEKFQRRQCGFGFKKLSELSEMNPERLLTSFGVESNNLIAFLKEDISPNPDMIVLFLKCLSKLIAVQFDVTKTDILLQVCNSKFIDVIQKYIIGLPYVKIENRWRNSLFWKEYQMFFENILKFSEAVINLSPSTAVQTFRVLFDTVQISLKGLQKHQMKIFSKDFLKNFEDIKVKLVMCVEEEENKKALHRSRKTKPEDDQPPPNNFRDISIMPSKEDLFGEPEFLRPNIVDGAYKNVEHYLDVHFRLMREDFIAPLRDAVKEYNESKDKKKQAGARFYRHAKLLRYILKAGDVVVEVCYDAGVYKSKHKNDRMTKSKRFMYGSLLCLTSDNFETLLFCTVHDRDDIASGKITVEMSSPLTDDMFANNYVLVESESYFPPYFHILKALQNPVLSTNFPFENYIINANAGVSPPEYLHGQITYTLFDDTQVVINDDSSWPPSDKLGLDESQYTAYKMALCREFVTIQGPPGTGKTFIGLKIAKTILENFYLGSRYKRRYLNPIIVVCFTNHALDQFLEGLLNITKKLVRIGGQSKNETIQEYSLINLRQSSSQHYHIKNNLRNYSDNIELLQAFSTSLQSNEHICDITNLPAVIKHNLDRDLVVFLKKFAKPDDQPALVNWLLLSDYRNFSKKNLYFEKASGVSMTGISISQNCEEKELMFEVRSHIQKRVRSYEFSSNDLKKKIVNTLSFLENNELDYWERQILTIELGYLEYELQHLEMRLLRGNSGYRKVDLRRHVEAHRYSPEDRWSLYWQWVEEMQNCLQINLKYSIANYKNEKLKYEEISQAIDLEMLKEAHVIGVTTSGAARLQSQLRSLRSTVVIVEEAAEVVESHVIVSLTKDCEHLIMIGDHKQLRPKTTTYRMAKKFNLDISLFERMLRNGTHCYQLGVQHRMRPEIAKLITPAIYENLQNNSNVELYPDVKGVLKNLYFVDHTVPESEVEDIASHMNDHEAQFVLNLAKYFIQQGYSPDEITILAAYSGQMFHLRREAKTMSLMEEVNINVLDNFQGEENKIILLSLVRSNPDGKIGFLATDNRVCVALSRAREGFYVIGNMTILKLKSQLWNSVNTTLMELDSIGPNLMLRCSNHQDVHTPVQTAQDFSQVPEGGCKAVCGKPLNCGHQCNTLCHPGDPFHEVVKCKEKCKRDICDLGHDCPRMCFQQCQPCSELVKRKLSCDHEIDLKCHYDYQKYKCVVKFNVELPLCHHQGYRFCHQDLTDAICEEPCLDRLACGHACRLKCHKKQDPHHLEYACLEKCTRLNKGCTDNHLCDKACHVDCSPCTVLVTKIRNCTHKVINVECHEDINYTPCTEKCKRSLNCGHFCKKLCKEICDSMACKVKVEKERSCGHKVKIGCAEDPETIKCTSKCLKTLPCGHQCLDLCWEPCSKSRCQQFVSNPFPSLCKHDFKIPCSKTICDTETALVLNMDYCQQPCGARLSCEHMCKGTCGQCAGGRLHVSCKEPCGFILVCGHSCNEPCREACPPCQKICEVRCKHSHCRLPCGVPCSVCKHPCPQRCSHGKCTKYCGEDCDIVQCSEACSKFLNCGHACRGLCGEQCPQICKVCKPDQFPGIFFGNEDDEDAKFIKLIDCPHVLEVTSLDKWMQQDPDGNISVKTCPHCKTRIINTPRYSNNVKQAQRNIDAAKKKLFGDSQENITKLDRLKKDIALLSEEKLKCVSPEWSQQLKRLEVKVGTNIKFKGKQVLRLSSLEINKLTVTFEILKKLKEVYYPVKVTNLVIIDHQVKTILKAVKQSGINISQQQSQDLENEISRLEKMINIINIEEQSHNEHKSHIDDLKTKIISSLEPFDENTNKTVTQELDNIRKLLCLSPLTVAERNMIVRVMNFKQGHWYMCPNGHPYCIADCGGAVMRSVCPECKEQIGGERHALLSTNRVATFMDGATRSAWPQTANMQNYDLDN